MKTFQLGQDKATGEIVDVKSVSSGLDCNCVCPSCGDDLVAVQGEQRRWYFRHYEKHDCERGYHKGLRVLALQILRDNNYFYIPKYGRLSYKNIEIRRPFSDLPLTSDVVLDTKYFPVNLQFKMTDEEEVGGYPGFEKAEINLVEIDLTDYVYTTKEHFESYLLNNIDNKHIWSWQEGQRGEALQRITAKENRPWVLGILGAGLAYALYRFLRSED